MLPEAVEELLDELEPKPTAEMVDAGTRATTAIEEMLRYEGPIQLNSRRLTEPLTLSGRTLPEGALVTLGIGAANRDPQQFPEPARLTSPANPTATSPSATATARAPA